MNTLTVRRLANFRKYSVKLPGTLSKLYSGLKPDELLSDGTPDYVRLILRSSVYDVIDESPLTRANLLSSRLNIDIQMKREDMLPVFSFKLRGAYNMISKLSEEQKKAGVIACSAGNHAQGVAYSSNFLSIPATIVMPVSTPAIKYQNVARLGAEVVLYGGNFDDAKAECDRITKERGLTNIPPFDHPYVIAGQGTVATEILRQVHNTKLAAIFCPVGGGGLIAGIGSYVKRIAPHVKVIGVETKDASTLHDSLKYNKRITLDSTGTFADGTSVRVLGEETYRVAKEVVDDVILVDTDELCAAIEDIFMDARVIVEPSGALSVAGMKKYFADPEKQREASGKTFIPILSGANMNFDRLRFVSERAVLGQGKEVFMMFTIPDTPGSFRKLHSVIHPRHVTEFSYRYNQNTQSSDAHIYASFTVSDREPEIADVIERLENLGFGAVDISDNELAKSHCRYLVGGSTNDANERLIAFEFPERKDALSNFLAGIDCSWNVTLFHYRNHGADVGKVLVGISVPPEDNANFEAFLIKLGYQYQEHTDNIAYQRFLRH
ncbi:HCL549Cp [Eremothecium sinecaudum]|uniref:Threonine dehydratase n=1 Tax=Eremothecium sinecaudum TaxID=45286 RepID=A0A109UYD6_9SACH|nr:HCL549Cp [Eremothecium sinecaudum]AMD19602.1 HCL549Cp [Eremothecium sinecaudum]